MDAAMEAGDAFEGGASGGAGPGPGVSTAAGTGGGGGGLPPEEELEASFRAPVATSKYVWVANPESGRVAFIDAASLSVELADAGHAPTHLAPVPHPTDDVAIVLNVLSLDATLLKATATGVEASTLPVPGGGNAWAISSDGRWATAWTDAREIEGADPIDGFQDITVLDLVRATSTVLAVGYRPVELGYDVAGKRLFAVTRDGITIVALDGVGPAVLAHVALSDDPLEPIVARDVAITPDGAFALVRRDGDATVRIFSLPAGARTDVTLPGPVTDLDLSRDGALGVAVVRDTSEVGLLPLPAVAVDPGLVRLVKIEGALAGSVALADESPLAFLYTNAVESPVLTVLDTSADPPSPKSILLHAPVGAVLPTRDASHAVVAHLKASAGSKYQAAVSLVPVAAGLPSKILGLEQPLAAVAVAPAGDRVLLAAGGTAAPSYRMLLASLPSLEVASHPLASLPTSAGIVSGAARAYVAQEHPDGRITFKDLASGEVRTLTGFELGAKVVDGGGK
jgi:hypothetical protein